jgi:hypothetical protein
MKIRVLLAACVTLTGVGQAEGRFLYDFEQPEELAAIRIPDAVRGPADELLALSDRYVTSGAHSLRIAAPAWKEGLPPGLHFRFNLPHEQMASYDRLVVDMTNPTDADLSWLMAFTAPDSPVHGRAMQKPPRYYSELPGKSCRRFTIHLKALCGKDEPSEFAHVSLLIWKPAADVEVYLDRMLLLKPGEAVPPVPAAKLDPMRALMAKPLAEVARRIDAVAAKGRVVGRAAPRVVPFVDDTLAMLRDELAQCAYPLLMRRRIDRLESILTMCLDAAALPQAAHTTDDAPYALFGVAPACVKVFPRDMAMPARAADAVRVDLARGETESAQLVVLPLGANLARVSVQVTDLTSSVGDVLDRARIHVAVVGHVLLDQKAMFREADCYHGWYPDPILEFLSTADIPRGDSQAFWLRVKAPHDQAPGRYTGTLTVTVGDPAVWRCPFEVRVRDFAVPRVPPLPVAINFEPLARAGDRAARNMPLYAPDGAVTNYAPDHPVNLWRRHKMEWVDFLADYYITYKSHAFDRGWEPDFEVVRHLKAEGRLGLWNLGLGRLPGRGKSHFGPRGRQRVVEDLRTYRYRYEKARELGLLDKHAYTYVADEVREDAVEPARELLKLIRDAYPDITLMSGGTDLGYEDVLVPAVPQYVDPSRQDDWAAARAAGKRVFWYIAHGMPPYPGMELESHAMEQRLLTGAMVAHHGVEGYLFWQCAVWNATTPITDGPYTNWPAISNIGNSGKVTHGNGQLTCVGPDGIPLATTRLESLRDGLEDYAYFRILEQTLAAVEADDTLAPRHKEWIQRAKHALDVPAALGSVTTYICAPDLLYRWRRELADAIEAAPDAAEQKGD